MNTTCSKRMPLNLAATTLLAALAFCGCEADPEVKVVKECPTCDASIWIDDVSTEDPDWIPWVDQVDPLRACMPNNDGVITAAEMPVFLGAAVSYRVNAPDTTLDVEPSGSEVAGEWMWDFRNVPNTFPVGVKVEDPSQYWFFEHFPDAEHASPVSLWDTSLLGVYKDEDGVTQMLGVASKEKNGAVYTLIKYDEPVRLFQFPIQPGAQWSQTVHFSNAVVQGVQNAGTETYSFTVDGRGTMLLPDFTLENTLRVRLQLSQTFVVAQGKPTTTHIWYMYVHECLGEVARIVSLPDETEKEFTKASEFRRLGL